MLRTRKGSGRPRWCTAVLSLLALGVAVGGVLLLEAKTSQAHAAAVVSIEDPGGQVALSLGTPTSIILVGSSSKTLTVGGVSRACGSNRYVVFAERGVSLVKVALRKPVGQWDWTVEEVTVGWNSNTKPSCSL